MIMKYLDYFQPGTCNSIDAATGFKVKLSSLQQNWQGYWVNLQDWNPRQPQDFPIQPIPQKVYHESYPEQVQPIVPPPLTQFY